jgi:hypothetical protein
MEIASLVLSILAFILAAAGCLLGGWAVVQVLAMKRSTHTVTHVPIVPAETTVEADLPQHIVDQLPSPPEKMSATDYIKWVARQSAADEFFDE